MKNEELNIAYKCLNSIGNSIDLKVMIIEVLTTLKEQTEACFASFYLKNENEEFDLIHSVGKYKNINLKEYKNYSRINIIQEKENSIVFLPLDKAMIILIYPQDQISKEFLDTLFSDLIKKLNSSIHNCLNTKELENKNKRLRLLAKELDQQRLELIDSNRLKDIFLANMSHELKTPLNSIIVISSVMANNKQSKLDDIQVKNMKIINDCGNELLYLINDVLDISKLEAGEVLLELDETDIVSTLNDLKEMFDPLIKSKGLVFEYKSDSSIGMIYTDKNRVRQIIKNLLSNALKFSKEGQIQLYLEDDDKDIKIIVKDDGIGIPQDKLEHIFDRFKQVDASTSRKFGGSGLGLAISKELTHLLGGKITVNSKINNGATFILTLPKRLNKVLN